MVQDTRALAPTSHADGPRLTVVEHLGELRRRLLICVATIIATTIVGFVWAERVIGWLKEPAGVLLPRLAFFSPTEALSAYCKVALTIGIVLAVPMILYQLWAFVRIGLTGRERSYGVMLVGWGSLLFAAGVAAGYYVCLPMFLKFLLRIGWPNLEPVISIDQYLGFVTSVLLMCGLIGELPLVIVLLAKLGIVTPAFLQRQRPWAIIVMLVISAVATPTTDAFTMLVMAVPLIVLYELSIWICRLVVRPQPSA